MGKYQETKFRKVFRLFLVIINDRLRKSIHFLHIVLLQFQISL